MPFSRPRFTNAGRQLQLRAIGGTNINFTKIKVGDGVIPDGADFREFTDLVSPKATLALTKIRVEDGYAKITGYFNNSGLSEAFYYRELGLYATDPDDPTNEILYCYANYGDDSVYIADPAAEIIERSVTIVAIVDDAENVTATLDTSAVYVTEPELEDVMSLHNTDPTAHPNLQNSTKTKVLLYINPGSTETAENRTGTASHPFKYLGEALTAYPPEAVGWLTIVLVSSFTLYADSDKETAHDNGTYTVSGYDEISIYGASSNYVKFPGTIKFFGCGTVLMRHELYSYTSSSQVHVNSRIVVEGAWIAKLKLKYNVNPDVFDSTDALYEINNCELTYLNGAHAEMKKSPSNGVAYIVDSVVRSDIDMAATVSTAYQINASKADTIVLDFGDNDEGFETDGDNDCQIIYLDSVTINALLSGSFMSHPSRTDNPHNVTLSQAAAAGGVLPVSNGGTGKTSFTSGHVLIGNGSNGISSVASVPVSKGGTGQTSLTDGNILLGAGQNGIVSMATLPISKGGTGRNDSGVTVVQNPNYNAASGRIILPGSPGVLIVWGRGLFEQSTTIGTQDVDISFGISFDDATFSITFGSYNDIDFVGGISKSRSGATVHRNIVSGGADDRAFDFIAIGKYTPS